LRPQRPMGKDRKTRVVIMGAGGRDFHNFNLVFRKNPDYQVVAFTATQIPFQKGRCYPPALAGPLYPKGIPILGQDELPSLIRYEKVDEVIFAYSDVCHQEVMRTASMVLALGADFRFLGPERTMLPSRLPVISVCAVRTGCGKSPLTRYLCRLLKRKNRRPVVVRHPMAYGRLELRKAEVFESLEDLDRFQCTLEEREEYEPLINLGVPLLAGVDYEIVLAEAIQRGDIILWDGGNNDFPFYHPGLEIVMADPLRPGDEISYYPGMVNLLRADVVVMAKADGAPAEGVALVEKNIRRFNPSAEVLSGALEVLAADPEAIRGRRVAVVEDGPTLTHGGMAYGAGVVAARRYGAQAIVDPRPYAVGSLADVFRAFPHLAQVVPAMGYSPDQLSDLKATLEAIPCDLILSATPVALGDLLHLVRPLLRVTYEFRELKDGSLEARLDKFLLEERR
jgi:predicted GTPase